MVNGDKKQGDPSFVPRNTCIFLLTLQFFWGEFYAYFQDALYGSTLIAFFRHGVPGPTVKL